MTAKLAHFGDLWGLSLEQHIREPRTHDSATNSLTLDPSRALEPGATYVARVRFLATDEAGNDLQEITAWSSR